MKRFMIVAFYFLLLAISIYELLFHLKEKKGLKAYSKQVRAKITKITSEKIKTNRSSYYMYYVHVRYCVALAKKKKVHRVYFTNKFAIGDKKDAYKKGDYIRINYIPDAPKKSIYEPFKKKEVKDQLIFSILFLGIVVMFIGWRVIKFMCSYS